MKLRGPCRGLWGVPWFGRRAPSLGARGERAAARHLRRAGYRILARNVRGRLGEIDLVAYDRARGMIAVVEVKTTTGDDPPPEVHVDHRKRRKLTALAMELLQRRGWDGRPIRFDIVAVVWPDGARQPACIRHHDGAFEAQW